MKLVVISAAFPPLPVGEADHAFHLCHRLAEHGVDVHVLTTKVKNIAGGLPFSVHAIMPRWTWPELPRLARFLKRCSPDAVLLIYSDRDYSNHPMITLAPSVSKALLPSSRFITQLETEYVSRRASLLTRAVLKAAARLAPKSFDSVFGTLLRASDRIITLSEGHLARLSSGFADLKGKGVVIPPPALVRISPENGIGARARGRQRLGVSNDAFLIAYYGYVYPEKGIEVLFNALRLLERQRRNVKLVMIGGGNGRDEHSAYAAVMRNLSVDLGIQNDVLWTGEHSSDGEEASIYLRAADAGVFPFKYGVTLNRSSVATATTHGLPIVTTRGDALESPFIDGENVLLVPPDDPASLAAAVCLLMDDEAQRQKLKEGALKLAAECFSWDKAVRRTIEALAQ